MRLLSVLGVILGVGVVSATPPCHVQQIQAVQAVQYATPVLPLYTIGYQQAVDLSPLLDELRLMRQEIQQLRAGSPIPLEEPVGMKLLRENCAKCHSGATAKKGFRVFDDRGVLTADPVAVGKIVESIHEDSMPPVPAKKLTFEEKYKVLRHLAVQPVAKGK